MRDDIAVEAGESYNTSHEPEPGVDPVSPGPLTALIGNVEWRNGSQRRVKNTPYRFPINKTLGNKLAESGLAKIDKKKPSTVPRRLPLTSSVDGEGERASAPGTGIGA